MNDKELEHWFNNQQGNWDLAEPKTGHKARFLTKLNQKPAKNPVFKLKNWWKPLAVAASFTLLVSFLMFNKTAPKAKELADISPKMEQTQDFFTTSIAKDLERLKNQNSLQHKKLVEDALQQLEKLEKDYKKLKSELAVSGENKRVIHAMITNFQTRIALLTQVMEQIDNTKSLIEQKL